MRKLIEFYKDLFIGHLGFRNLFVLSFALIIGLFFRLLPVLIIGMLGFFLWKVLPF